MAKDLIRYDLIVQEALRGVVRKVLTDAAKNGMLGDHHFYVTFRTKAPGVRLSDRMREKYPEEMNIILQHQFWDLSVNENAFEVGLSFGGAPERLLVPFEAISGFYDPSVEFGLKFELHGEAALTDGAQAPEKAASKPALALAAVKPSAVPARLPVKIAPAPARPAMVKPDKPVGKDKADANSGNGNNEKPDTKVISIDAFRKKP